jgi:hypothetical protein
VALGVRQHGPLGVFAASVGGSRGVGHGA